MEDIIDLYIGKENVKTIIEAGACDCEDSIKLSKTFPNAHVYAFECNRMMIPICKNKIVDKKWITLTEKALSDVTGEVTFYPIDTEKTRTTHLNGNPGASSMFIANKDYPMETYAQTTTEVESIRLDDFLKDKDIKEVDLLWLDAQGSELSILKGMGESLNKVKVIKTEVLFKPQYEGAPLFEEMEEFLEKNNFTIIRYLDKFDWFGDILVVNNKLL